jgi:hypothetical protein
MALVVYEEVMTQTIRDKNKGLSALCDTIC